MKKLEARSNIIKSSQTGEKFARVSLKDGKILIHFWSKVQKKEVSIRLDDIVTSLLKSCEQEHKTIAISVSSQKDDGANGKNIVRA